MTEVCTSYICNIFADHSKNSMSLLVACACNLVGFSDPNVTINRDVLNFYMQF